MTYYAHWTEADRLYTIEWWNEEGTEKIDSKQLAYGTPFTGQNQGDRGNKPGGTGYDGWYTQPNKNGHKLQETDAVQSDAKYYAGWNQEWYKYKVSFDSRGLLNNLGIAVNIPVQKVTYNELAEAPDLSAYTDFTLAGWYYEQTTKKNGRTTTTKVDWDFATSKVTDDVTLMPKWSKIQAYDEATLRNAFKYVGVGANDYGTVVMTDDITIKEQLQSVINGGVTFDGGGHKITFNGTGTSSLSSYPINFSAIKITIKNLTFTGTGGIFLQSQSLHNDERYYNEWYTPDQVLENVTFDNCRNGKNGGAVYIFGGWAKFDKCNFTNNSAAYGGAVYVEAFTGNSVFCKGSLTKFVGCTFRGNSATSGGSNVYIGGERDASMDWVMFESCSGVTNGTYKGNSNKTGKAVG